MDVQIACTGKIEHLSEATEKKEQAGTILASRRQCPMLNSSSNPLLYVVTAAAFIMKIVSKVLFATFACHEDSQTSKLLIWGHGAWKIMAIGEALLLPTYLAVKS